MGVSQETKKKKKNQLPYDPAISPLGIHLNKIKTLIGKDKQVQKQPKCPSIDERIKKIWYIFTMEYYSVMKNSEILLFATMWMDLEGIMLSEINHTNTA